jgi:hypothetical protein
MWVVFSFGDRHVGGPRFCTTKEIEMIKVGDALPAATLMEFVEVEGNGCSIGPNPVKLPEAAAGKTIAVFAVPGAFTPTCSAKHVPGFVEQAEAFKAAGVDEIWCLSVNDAFVMGAWARDQKTDRKERQGPGPAQQPLLHAGQGRQGGHAERGRPRQVRGQRRCHPAGPGQGLIAARALCNTWPAADAKALHPWMQCLFSWSGDLRGCRP